MILHYGHVTVCFCVNLFEREKHHTLSVSKLISCLALLSLYLSSVAFASPYQTLTCPALRASFLRSFLKMVTSLRQSHTARQ